MQQNINFSQFNGITAFARLDDGKRYPLSLKSNEDNMLLFADDSLGISFKATLEGYDQCNCLRFKAEYNPKNLGDIKGRNHFDTECAVGINIRSIEDLQKFVALCNIGEFWIHPFFGELNEMPPYTQSLLVERDNGYRFMTTVCDNGFVSTIRGYQDGFDLYTWNNCYANEVNTIVLAWEDGSDIYELPRMVHTGVLAMQDKQPLPREDKPYPPIFEYLGWCSWDAFHMDVTHEDLLKKAEEFKEKNIPVRWFILDDMWGDVPNNNIPTMHSRELNSFEAAPDRFPYGLKGCAADLKNRGLSVGLWHPTTGYWHGINPNSQLAREYGKYLFWANNAQLIPCFEREKILEYYDRQYQFYKECGIDFMKTDNQSHLRVYERLAMPIGIAAENLHHAIETAVNKYFGGQLINCMGMATENFWNRESSVCRFSGDFMPENRRWFAGHLLQCSYNSVVQGSIYYGDWDMWWSDDTQALKNSVIRAMSGGPIYVSDRLGRSIRAVILPTVYDDGKIIRLNTPARPSYECMFSDCRKNSRAFKLFNRHNENGILAVFNIDDNENKVFTRISARDMNIDFTREYCVYDWFERKAFLLKAGEEFEIALKDYDDFKLYLFVPFVDEEAVVGLADKYMSVATFRRLPNGKIEPFGEGPLLSFKKSELRSSRDYNN